MISTAPKPMRSPLASSVMEIKVKLPSLETQETYY